MKHEIKPTEVGCTINVEDIFKAIHQEDMTVRDFTLIESYYEKLKKAKFIEETQKGFFYDKSQYDYYVVIEGASSTIKVVMKRNIAYLVFKHRVLEYLIMKRLNNGASIWE